MQLRYAGNLIPPVDGMQKISSICWSPNGKKMAVASADRVIQFSHRQFISLTTQALRKTSFLQSLQKKDKKPILLGLFNFLQIQKK